MKKFLLSMLGVLLALPGIARDFTYEYKGQTLTYTVIDEDAKTCQVAKMKDIVGALIIPSVASDGTDDFTVTSIVDGAFYLYNKKLSSVVLPNTITKIPLQAFNACSALSSVKLGESVTTIGAAAFKDCTSLRSMKLPDGISVINAAAFNGCSSLTTINVPASLVSIGDYAFSDTRITTFFSNEALVSIGTNAFSRCKYLRNVYLGHNVTSVGSNVFKDCINLTKLVCPEGLFSTAPYGNMLAYNDTMVFEDGLIYSSDKSSILHVPGNYDKTVVLPSSVTSYRSDAFYDCQDMKGLILSPNIVWANIRILDGLSYRLKFAYPKSLSKYLSESSGIVYPNDAIITSDGMIYSADKAKLFYAPAEIEDTWAIDAKVTEIGDNAFISCDKLKNFKLTENVTIIGSNSFAYCEGLRTIVLENISKIGRSAFYYCTNLESVKLSDNITSIQESTFFNCKSLNSINLPSGLTAIEDNAFYNCSNLTNIVLPESLETIGSQVFKGCIGFTDIVFGSSLQSIGSEAFQGISYEKVWVKAQYPPAITSDSFDSSFCTLTFPAGSEKYYMSSKWFEIFFGYRYNSDGKEVKTYLADSNTDQACSYYLIDGDTPNDNVAYLRKHMNDELTSFLVPERITDTKDPNNPVRYRVVGILNDAFNGKRKLSELKFHSRSKLEYIGPRAFTRCKISEVDFPETLTEIADSAFLYCSLKTLTLPASVKSIGKYSFAKNIDFSGNITYRCLKEICLNEGLEYIGAGAFSRNTELNKLVIPSSIKHIGADAFKEVDKVDRLYIPNWDIWCGIDFDNEFATPPNPKYINDDYNNDRPHLTIPDGVKEIKQYCFYRFFPYYLDVNLPGTIEVIEDSAFKKVNTLDLKYSESLLEIKPSAFESLSHVRLDRLWKTRFNAVATLESVFLGDNITEIPHNMFRNANVNLISWNKKIRSIGNNAFDGCPLTYYETGKLPESLESIGARAFRGSHLENIEIPNTTIFIGEGAFEDNPELASVKIGDGLKAIPADAFKNDPKLTDIQLGKNIETIASDAFYVYLGMDKILYCTDIDMPESLRYIGDRAFEGRFFRAINISDIAKWCDVELATRSSLAIGFTADGTNQYHNGVNLSHLVIPEGVKEIKPYTFMCQSYLELPGSVDKISEECFFCYNDNEISITLDTLVVRYSPKPLNFTSYYPFKEVKHLVYDRTLDDKLFYYYMKNLKSVEIGNTVTEIPASRFSNKAELTSVKLSTSLKTIGAKAFSKCNLKGEIIIPHYVETIGESAFEGNDSLENIIIGHRIKSIGDKAFTGCRASNISITAQTPPSAPYSIFSSYTGNLYVQGQDAADAYYDAYTCWDRFDAIVMIEPTELKVEGDRTLSGKPGDTFQLTATLWPENVTLPQVFWRSTNPDIATVDANGLVTLHADLSEVMAMAEGDDDTTGRSCKIIAESLYADGPVAEFTVNDFMTGIDEINDGDTPSDEIDFNTPVQVYNLQGVMVSDSIKNLASGIYIVRQGKNVKKIAVR